MASLGHNELDDNNLITHCRLVSQNKIDLDNGLFPHGTKPLPEPMLLYCHLDP